MSTATFTTPTTTPTTPTAAITATTTVPSRSTAGRVTWKRGLGTGVVAAVVVTAVAAAFQAVGATLSLTDGALPLASFGQMVMLATVVGVLIARHTSRTTFYRVTVALTALSCVPDLAWGDGVVSKAGLVLTHVVAAAIIVPRLARR
jgi:Family of unknown function (DUF6069)